MNNPNSQHSGDKTPRVCLLTETFYPVVGGGESHARLLANRLNSIGMSTWVLTRRSHRDYSPNEIVDNIPTCRIPPSCMKRFGKYAMVPYVMRELSRSRDRYDLILICGFRVLGIPAVMMARRLGKVCVLRSETLGELSGGYASAYRKLPLGINLAFQQWISMRNRVLKQADAFISISKPVYEEFASSGIDESKIYLISNGIDTDLFKPVDEESRKSLRTKLGLPPNDIIVSYSGKLNQGKGLEYLIEAWKTIASTRSNMHLLLIGSGGGQSLSCEAQLRSIVNESGLEPKVTFTGYVENVYQYLQASDLFVFPSENESFGLSLVEAMSCSLPIIASRLDAIQEIVDDGNNGILVKPREPFELAREITTIVDNPLLARSLACNAYQIAREGFSIESVAARYYELFSSLHSARKVLLGKYEQKDSHA